MHDRKQCLECKYFTGINGTCSEAQRTCSYAEMEGKCRIIAEMEMGTYKAKECSFFVPKGNKKHPKRKRFLLPGSNPPIKKDLL